MVESFGRAVVLSALLILVAGAIMAFTVAPAPTPAPAPRPATTSTTAPPGWGDPSDQRDPSPPPNLRDGVAHSVSERAEYARMLSQWSNR
ncbi:MAG TPA: hypothetical protein VGM93_02850 [Acidimicrobiales bacterium]|jgi:hypothetical protein